MDGERGEKRDKEREREIERKGIERKRQGERDL